MQDFDGHSQTAYMGVMGDIYLKNLATILEQKNIRQRDLADKIGVGQPFVSKLKSMKQAGSLDVAYAIAKALKVPLSDLTGEPTEPPEPLTQGAKSKKGPPPDTHVRIPLVSGKIAAGQGLVSDDSVEEWLWLHRNQLKGRAGHKLVCIRVKGRSMKSAIAEQSVAEGAIICVDQDDRPSKGNPPHPESMYAVRVDGDEIVLKRLHVTDHIMMLISANPDVRSFPPRSIDLRKHPDPVIGKVVWKWEECP